MKQNNLRRTIDIGMTVLLLLQMAYQVMGEAAHEWLGMGMTALVIVHQLLNRRWYGAMLKGRYNAYRAVSACVNVLLLISFALTAFCGMAMSNYAVPFLYGIVRVSFVRVTHLSMSHWSFVLMGLHLGLHVPVMLAKLKMKDGTRRALDMACAAVAGVGLWLFFKNGMPNYLFFRVPFAFLDYEKAGALVLMENVVMLLFWAFVGCQVAQLCGKKGNAFIPVTLTLAAVGIGLTLNMIWPGNHDTGFDSNWGSPAEAPWQSPEPEPTAESAPLDDGFVRIEGGAFQMGSPKDENWRIDDETQRETTVNAFYIDPYETTQAEWATVMGSNPSTFTGEKLPVENISWGGNTRGIAREIQRQTGFDLFEIEPVPAYSDDYNTVLMEAQRDQHAQARPEIAGQVENMADYDTVLLGYPNWWASIPMPIASFLEQYDFSGKRIIPFCSHGGGRFGQSLTAIAKLAPESNIGQGLSVHYSGGSTLSEDVSAWLEANHLKPEA